MRRKPICLAILALFGAGVVLGNRLLADQIIISSSESAPTEILDAPEDDTSTNDGLIDFPDIESTTDIPDGVLESNPVEAPTEVPIETPAEPPIEDEPPLNLDMEQAGEPDFSGGLDTPAEETPPIIPEVNDITPAEDYFIRVSSPRSVAMLSSIEVPRTGGEAPSSLGAGSNSADDVTTVQDGINTTISTEALAIIGSEPHRSSLWPSFFITVIVLLALLTLYSLAAHFLR